MPAIELLVLSAKLCSHATEPIVGTTRPGTPTEIHRAMPGTIGSSPRLIPSTKLRSAATELTTLVTYSGRVAGVRMAVTSAIHVRSRLVARRSTAILAILTVLGLAAMMMSRDWLYDNSREARTATGVAHLLTLAHPLRIVKASVAASFLAKSETTLCPAALVIALLLAVEVLLVCETRAVVPML